MPREPADPVSKPHTVQPGTEGLGSLARTGLDWRTESGCRLRTGVDWRTESSVGLKTADSEQTRSRDRRRLGFSALGDLRGWSPVGLGRSSARYAGPLACESTMPLNLADFTFKQYPAKEQAELKVRIKVPGSWFNGLQGAERACMYEVQAYDWVEAHSFKKSGGRQTEILPAIKFLCEEDVFEDPKHAGFIMRLSEWNR